MKNIIQNIWIIAIMNVKICLINLKLWLSFLHVLNFPHFVSDITYGRLFPHGVAIG